MQEQGIEIIVIAKIYSVFPYGSTIDFPALCVSGIYILHSDNVVIVSGEPFGVQFFLQLHNLTGKGGLCNVQKVSRSLVIFSSRVAVSK